MTPEPDSPQEAPDRDAAAGEPHPAVPSAAECQLLLLSDGRILAHQLTPEIHRVLAHLFPES